MKRKLLILMLFIATNIFAQSKPISSVPITVEENTIYLNCKINKTDHLKFLFDTGASGSVINKQSLNKFQLKIDGKSLNQGSNGINEIETSSGNELIIGDLSKNDVVFSIIPFNTMDFDGIIGTDLMKGYIIEIDYEKKLLNFYNEKDKSINYEGFTRLKLYSDIYPTYLKSTIIIDGKKYSEFFGLDTGADDALTIASPFAKENDFISKTINIGTAGFQGSDGSVYEMPIVLLPEIEFAEKHFYRIPTALSNATEGVDATDKLAGFIGNAFLKKFNTILDYENQYIYFKLNSNLYKDFYE